MYEALPGDWSRSWETRGRLAYTNSRFADAVRMYAAALKSRKERIGVHYDRALAFLAMERPDSALAELTVLLDKMRRQDVKRLVSIYESKAMYEYATGSILTRLRRYDEAREAFGRALAEDLSLAVVHAALGGIARAQGDTASALRAEGGGAEEVGTEGNCQPQLSVISSSVLSCTPFKVPSGGGAWAFLHRGGGR